MRIFGKQINSTIFSNSSRNEYLCKEWRKVQENALKMKRMGLNMKQYPNFQSEFDREIKKQLNHKLVLVHTIRSSVIGNTELLLKSAEEVMSKWDVISTSLTEINNLNNKRLQWANIGLVLAVPPQNIIGTFPEDISFPNHAGNMPGQRRNSYELADSYFNGISKYHNKPEVRARLGKIMPNQTYAELETPENIIMRSTGAKHNEIIVVGKENVNIFSGQEPTKNIKVCGIYHYFNGGGRNAKKEFDEDNKLLRKLEKLNPDIPLIRKITP